MAFKTDQNVLGFLNPIPAVNKEHVLVRLALLFCGDVVQTVQIKSICSYNLTKKKKTVLTTIFNFFYPVSQYNHCGAIMSIKTNRKPQICIYFKGLRYNW